MKRQRNTFLTPLVVGVMPTGKRFKLHYDFIYLWKQPQFTVAIKVPAGFVTDFASIPRIFRIIIPKLGRWNKAAVIHDYLYQQGTFNRKETDTIFCDAMKDLGVKPWKYTLMYWAVRIGGWMAWRKSSY